MGDTSSGDSDDESHSLRRAFEHVKVLREENAVLRENFENLKTLYKERTSEKERLDAKCAALFEERVGVENQYQRLCEEWRAEVAEKHRAFEDARSQILQPRELELLRLKLIDELEVPHRNKCQALEHEAEVAQQQFVKARKEAEQLRSDLETAAARHAKELALLQSEHEAERQAAQLEIIKLQEAAAARGDSLQQLRAAQKEVAALIVQKRDLIQEIDDIRKEKEAAVVAAQRSSIEFERQLHALKGEEQQARRMGDGLARKCRHLEAELEAATAGSESAHQRVMELEREQAAASALAEESIHKLQSNLYEAENRLRVSQSEWEEHSTELQAALDEKDQLLTSLTGQHKEDLEQAAAELARRVREEEDRQRERRRVLEGEAADLRAALADAEQAGRDAEVAHAQTVEELNKEVDAVRKELGQVRLQLRGVQLALTSAQDDVARAKTEAREAQQEVETLNAESLQLRQRIKELADEHIDMREAKERAEAQLSEAERELAEVVAGAASERQELQQHLADAQGAWALEKAALTRRAAELAKEEVEKYKSRAAAASQRARKCKGVLQELVADRQQLLLRLSEAEAQAHALLSAQQKKEVVVADFETEGVIPAHKRSAAWYRAELAQLRERQAKYLQQLA